MTLRRRWWDIGAGVAALLVLVGLTLLRASQTAPSQISMPSTFDFGRSGYSALYDLLQKEGVRVGRFERSHVRLSGVSSALLIAQVPYEGLGGGTGLTHNGVIAIKDWVLHGGRLIVLSPPYGDAGDTLLGIPATRSATPATTRAVPFAELAETTAIHAVDGNFAAEFRLDAAPKALPTLTSPRGIVALQYRFGRGTVVAITDPSIFSNQRLADGDNARFAYNLFSPTGVEFDESIHGYSSERSLWSALPLPAHLAVYLVLAALLLALIGNMVRFAPPVELRQADDRYSSAYLTAMAGLLEHAGAARRVLHDRADFTLRAVRRALGLSEHTDLSVLLSRVDRAPIRSEITELNQLGEIERPTAAQLVRAGVLCAKLDQEFGI